MLNPNQEIIPYKVLSINTSKQTIILTNKPRPKPTQTNTSLNNQSQSITIKHQYINTRNRFYSSAYKPTSVMEAPSLVKVVLTVRLGKYISERLKIEKLVENLTNISGQKPVVTKASKAVANFKIKQGDPVGLKVTIRNARMFEFLDKLINISLPRIRDFRGIPNKSFDPNGNLNIGILDQMVFPEINYTESNVDSGMNICIVMNANSQEHAKTLLSLFNFPFKDTDNG